MSLLDIHVFGSPVLRAETERVTAVTDAHRRLVDDMLETMYVAQGIGLAAPQVGRRENLAVVDLGDEPFAIFNAEVVRASGSAKAEEGCLSIPDIFGDVERATSVLVRGLDRDGKLLEIEATDLLARCLQHEIDHLHGRLFTDYFSILRKRSAMAKWEKIKADYPQFLRKATAEEIAEFHSAESL